MKLKVSWHKPVQLEKAKDAVLIYSLSRDKIPEGAGVYIFARRYAKDYEALYVGQSEKLRSRIQSHLNNLSLMKYLENAKYGKRFVIIGEVTHSKKHIKKALKTLERALIRNFLAEGHNLANQLGVKIKRHEITSEGIFRKSFIPSTIYLEKQKGE